MSAKLRPWLVIVVIVAACGGGAEDEGTPDAPPSSADAAIVDARPVDAFVAPLDCTTTADHPEKLGCTGLYSDWASRTIAPTARAFKPGFELWSDGAAKSRWIELPAGTKIDASDPSAWVFPVGTKVWKEFRLDTGNGLRPIETRLLWKRASGWLRTTYVWSEDGREASEVRTGVPNVPGTGGYTIPATSLCVQCHSGRVDDLLGFEAISLAAPEATGLTYAELQRLDLLMSSNGRHTLPASSLQVPGTPVERTALGVLHANCGVSCHNPIGGGGRFEARLEVGASGGLGTVLASPAVQTMVNQHSTYRPPNASAGTTYYRLHPLDVTRSTALERMGKRGEGQMPPIATGKVDPAGVAAVTAWVNAMTVGNGYPPPAP